MAQEVIVFLLAATPVVEVRGSVPLGLFYGLSPLKVYLLSVLGSILPIIPVLLILRYLTDLLRKVPIMDRFFLWLFARTRARSGLIEDFEALGLMLFVAIPFPGTGIWTGCVAAYLMGISYRKAVPACILGTMIAAGLMLAAGLGIIRLL